MAAPRSRSKPEPPGAAVPLAPLVLVLLCGFVLQLHALSRVDGYPIADSVEYLERARLVLDGAALDPGTVRSFSFSALLVPLVAVFRGLGDAWVLGAARLAMMLLGLATVVVVARTTARLVAGARDGLDERAGMAGLVAAFALAINPVFLRWSVEPLSGTAAMLCVALGILALTRRGGFARGLMVGAALGAAFLMAFQSLAVIACVGGLLLLRDRWRGRAHTFGWVTAIALFLAIQATIDLAVYGSFGSSLLQYVKENFATTVGSLFWDWGGKQAGNPLSDLGLRLYNWGIDTIDVASQAAGGELRHKQSRTWYAEHLHTHAYALPLLALLAIGLLRSVRRPRWTTTILVATCALNAVAMSRKGSQSFRLWLPLLPMLSVLIGLGWAWITTPGPLRALRSFAAFALLVAGLVMGTRILHDVNLAKHGGYWDAMEFVASERAAGEQTLAAGYHWATLFRDGGEGLTQTKLPHALYAWPSEEELRAPLRADTIAALDSLDWFVSHLQLVEQDPAIAAAIAERFEVVAAFHDGETYEDLAPILVFRRAGDDASEAGDARRLFAIARDADPGAVQSRVAHPRSIDLRRRFEGGVTDQLVLLGWDAEVLPGSDNVAWLSLRWYAGPTNGRDYTFNVRVTDPDARARQVNRAPCWGAAPTSSWEPGWIVTDGVPIALDAVPGPGGALLEPLGGANRRGDLIPLSIWLATPRYEIGEDGMRRAVGGLAPFQPSGLRPVHKERRDGKMVSDEGWVFSPDNLVLVGGFLVPVPPALRAPDDGRPLP